MLISGSVVGLFVGALFFNEGLIFEPQAWLFYGTSTLLVVLAYLKLKKHLVEISKSRANEIAYYRITRNVQVFEALLKASPQFDLTPSASHDCLRSNGKTIYNALCVGSVLRPLQARI